MSQDNSKSSDPKGAKAKDNSSSSADAPPVKQGKAPAAEAKKNPAPQGKGKAPAVATPVVIPPLFRPIDWITFGLTTLLVLIGYYLTLAPDMTLEDSGELATGAFYAGVPHPPGYPVWTVYSWFFTKLVPFGNVAWRVGLGSAVAGALSCGMVALLVSRGSSMMLESIEEFKTIERKLENSICLVCGLVAGMLIGFNGFMWSQADIVEVYTFGVLSLMGVLCCMLRWIYAPSQHRYLYAALFLFGVCFTNHQTLLVAAMGIQVGIVAVNRKLGRDMLFVNCLFYFLGLMAKAQGWTTYFNSPPGSLNMIFLIFNAVGLVSLVVCAWLVMETQKMFTDIKTVVIMGLLYVFGVSLYLYMPLASMSNPPMNWGYPRTIEGFIHALTRGQYEKANPANILQDPMRFIQQLGRYAEGTMDEFNIVYLVIAIIPFLFYFRLKNRERSWLACLSGVYFCLAVILLILLNPQPDRQSLELNRVFFTASHFMVAMGIGYGLALIAATLVARYEEFRKIAVISSVVATGIALVLLAIVYQEEGPGSNPTTFLFIEPTHAPEVRLAYIILVCMFGSAIILFAIPAKRVALGPLLSLFCLMPANSILTHWADNEQRGHMFGFWFGHDMFTPPFKGKDGKPLYPEMTKDAVLFGGTDPGRFAPTYMIFCESFVPPEKKFDPDFDRRDVYIITQNALADGTYLEYIRAHYNRSTQPDPYFFQSAFTPVPPPPDAKPEDPSLGRTLWHGFEHLMRVVLLPVDKGFTSLGDSIEKDRRAGTSFFKKEDFTDLSGLKARLNAGKSADPLSKYIFDNLTPGTQGLLGSGDEGALRKSLAKDLNALLEKELIFTPERFHGIKLSDKVQRFIVENPKSHTRIRLNRELLEEAYPKMIAKSIGGVFPDLEIHTPSGDDSSKAFEEYVADAQRRMQLNQLRPGEDVRIEGNRLQVSGQTAVMAINALLTKVIFDKNPKHEFYVEESFPLDWMYNYETPYGIIMKINREPVKSMTKEIIERDQDFWMQYSDRLIGNWVKPETSVKEICDFAEKVYHQHDTSTFKGSPTFLRDDNAQKAFSKLRSSIAGLYAWRINYCAMQIQALANRAGTNPGMIAAEVRELQAEQQRLLAAADFAYKQSFAFCPYSPEAVFRYSNLLISQGRAADAYLVAKTCLIFDPDNINVQQLTEQLKNATTMAPQANPAGMTSNPGAAAMSPEAQFEQMKVNYEKDPYNNTNAATLAMTYLQMHRTNDAEMVLDHMVNNPKADVNAIMFVAQQYAQTLANPFKLELTLARLTQVNPESPEAWYDLAAIRAVIRKNADSAAALKKCIELSNQRLATNAQALDLRTKTLSDDRFAAVRQMADVQKLLTGQK